MAADPLYCDHLNRDFAMTGVVLQPERMNIVIMFGLGLEPRLLEPGTRIDRPATLLDVYPFVLAVAGIEGPGVQAGLRRSLCDIAGPVLEEKGCQLLNAELFINPLWSH